VWRVETVCVVFLLQPFLLLLLFFRQSVIGLLVVCNRGNNIEVNTLKHTHLTDVYACWLEQKFDKNKSKHDIDS
jgi:hypothetical protein